MPDLETLIKVLHCLNGPYWKADCEHCPYGYQYYDDSGDTYFWTCDQGRIERESQFFLELYYMLVKENEQEAPVA